jgi:hypothetical protein
MTAKVFQRRGHGGCCAVMTDMRNSVAVMLEHTQQRWPAASQQQYTAAHTLSVQTAVVICMPWFASDCVQHSRSVTCLFVHLRTAGGEPLLV